MEKICWAVAMYYLESKTLVCRSEKWKGLRMSEDLFGPGPLALFNCVRQNGAEYFEVTPQQMRMPPDMNFALNSANTISIFKAHSNGKQNITLYNNM